MQRIGKFFIGLNWGGMLEGVRGCTRFYFDKNKIKSEIHKLNTKKSSEIK